jgi:hypothetical protein
MGHRPNKIDISKIIQENRQKKQLLIVESEWICKEGEASIFSIIRLIMMSL